MDGRSTTFTENIVNSSWKKMHFADDKRKSIMQQLLYEFEPHVGKLFVVRILFTPTSELDEALGQQTFCHSSALVS